MTATPPRNGYRRPISRRVQELERCRDDIADLIKSLGDRSLLEIERKARLAARTDSFPTATLGDGTSRSTSFLTPVERAAEERAFGKEWPDPTGKAIDELVTVLAIMRRLSHDAVRCLDFISHVGDASAGRQDSTAGSCQCCERQVTGDWNANRTEVDRLKAGYCAACYVAWSRVGRPDRYRFELDRRVWLAEQEARKTNGVENALSPVESKALLPGNNGKGQVS